jgi:phosphoglycolate phosphatase
LALLEALQIDHLFSTVVANDTLPWSKPDPRVILATIEMANAHHASAIMVGDSRTDINAARNAGIPIIAVDFGYSDVPVADLSPDKIVSNFDTLLEAIRSLLNAAR